VAASECVWRGREASGGPDATDQSAGGAARHEEWSHAEDRDDGCLASAFAWSRSQRSPDVQPIKAAGRRCQARGMVPRARTEHDGLPSECVWRGREDQRIRTSSRSKRGEALPGTRNGPTREDRAELPSECVWRGREASGSGRPSRSKRRGALPGTRNGPTREDRA
jgi:hypothetical protein